MGVLDVLDRNWEKNGPILICTAGLGLGPAPIHRVDLFDFAIRLIFSRTSDHPSHNPAFATKGESRKPHPTPPGG